MSCCLCSVLFSFAFNPGFFSVYRFGFMCDAELWGVNSMAFYRIDVVCFNFKQLKPQQRPKSDSLGPAFIMVHEWGE